MTSSACNRETLLVCSVLENKRAIETKHRQRIIEGARTIRLLEMQLHPTDRFGLSKRFCPCDGTVVIVWSIGFKLLLTDRAGRCEQQIVFECRVHSPLLPPSDSPGTCPSVGDHC